MKCINHYTHFSYLICDEQYKFYSKKISLKETYFNVFIYIACDVLSQAENALFNTILR